MSARHGEIASTVCGLLEEGVRQGVFPGAVAAIGRLAEPRPVCVLARAGVLAPGEREVVLDTPYDLASLTKPFVALTALRLAQQRQLDLHAPIADVLEELAGTPGGESTLAELLSHRAGLAPWGPLYAQLPGPAGSPEARAFMLREAATRLDASYGKRESVYSDFGYLLAGETLARGARLRLDALVRREVTAPLGIEARVRYAASLAPDARRDLAERAAPTEHDPHRGRLARGEVHDENCFAFGGIAGHAGLFGDAQSVLTFGLSLLAALEGQPSFVDQAILRWALTPRGPGYLVGFDQRSAEGSSAGALFSPRAFGHLGFTGTSLWCDPPRRLCAVLLTNRVHPTRENIAIRSFRPRFHDAVATLALALGGD